MFTKTIITSILDSIQKFSDRNAFCIDNIFYTYKQFAENISKIRIAVKNIPFENKKVCLVVNDDIETYASIIALWLEGKAYVPIHPHWPKDRCLDIVKQVNADLFLNSSEHVCGYMKSNPSEGVNILYTGLLSYEKDYLDCVSLTMDGELAYILFTSGSTGKPKGVMITRGNVSSFMDAFGKTGIEITETDRCLQCFDLTFDVSIQGYLVPLTKGACCYTVPHGQVKYIYVSGLIEDQKLTFGAMAPSMLRYLKPYFGELDATSFKNCILTAEACPLSLVEDWCKCAVNTEVYDFYGPTEATIYCTYYKLSKTYINKTLNGIVSIGKPLAGISAIVVDEDGNEVTQGEKGELCVAGGQITMGYWDNDDMNESAFFEKEFNGKRLRFYHTGDLCFQDVDGDIMYSGRIDQQAKIQGFRVELGEIEFHAREYLGGINVICVAYENRQHLTEIVMFVESEGFDVVELFEYMRDKMPSYMIPARVIFEPSFPLNSNDKIDRNRLKKSLL